MSVERRVWRVTNGGQGVQTVILATEETASRLEESLRERHPAFAVREITGPEVTVEALDSIQAALVALGRVDRLRDEADELAVSAEQVLATWKLR